MQCNTIMAVSLFDVFRCEFPCSFLSIFYPSFSRWLVILYYRNNKNNNNNRDDRERQMMLLNFLVNAGVSLMYRKR